MLVELCYNFILAIIRQQASNKAIIYFPILFLTFFFILLSNIMGLIPFGFTTTSNIIITFFLAFSFNLSFLILGFQKHGIKFLKVFVPKGAPLILMPLIIAIEILSYLLRTLSLSVRLFANMMAGHVLLHIVGGFVTWIISRSFEDIAILTILFNPVITFFLLLILELGIAFLQAYVFIILLCIYLNDSLNPGH
jgi:F-type H+-transporting ATPase subunit a